MTNLRIAAPLHRASNPIHKVTACPKRLSDGAGCSFVLRRKISVFYRHISCTQSSQKSSPSTQSAAQWDPVIKEISLWLNVWWCKKENPILDNFILFLHNFLSGFYEGKTRPERKRGGKNHV